MRKCPKCEAEYLYPEMSDDSLYVQAESCNRCHARWRFEPAKTLTEYAEQVNRAAVEVRKAEFEAEECGG